MAAMKYVSAWGEHMILGGRGREREREREGETKRESELCLSWEGPGTLFKLTDQLPPLLQASDGSTL